MIHGPLNLVVREHTCGIPTLLKLEPVTTLNASCLFSMSPKTLISKAHSLSSVPRNAFQASRDGSHRACAD